MNKIEAIKDAKHPLDVLDDIYRYAELGWESIPEDDWDRMKWYGVFFRKTTPGFFMMRLRMPNGILTSRQLATIGGIITDYGRDQADLTTRENIQLRWVRIENVPDIFARLASVGLTSQQSGMDNMRNVVGCPIAGLDPDEALDASGLAQAIQDSFVGVRDLSNLPRKFNASITGCRQDCTHAGAHDLSFTPATYFVDSWPIAGFNVVVGGSLGGRDPQFAQPLNAFVRAEEVVGLNRAVLEVFRDFGSRVARTKARLRYLIEDWGMERFRAEIEARFGEPLLPAGKDESALAGSDHMGVHPQRQASMHYVGMNVPVGRVTGTQLTELAALSEQYGRSEVRITPDQNCILPYVHEDRLPELLAEPLLSVLSPFPKPVLRGLVACTGIDYCHFSLIDTKGAALDLEAALPGVDRDLRIHMSGCANACGQHHLGDISLLGARVRIDGEIVDAVDVAVGGRLRPGVAIPQTFAKGVPLTELPAVISRILSGEVSPVQEVEPVLEQVK